MLRILQGDGGLRGIAAMLNHHARATEVHVVGKDQAQRRLAQRILFRRRVGHGIEDGDLPAARDNQPLVGRGIIEARAAGPPDRQLPGRDGAVGVHLSESRFRGCEAVEIAVDLIHRNLRRSGQGQGDEGRSEGEDAHGQDLSGRWSAKDI